MNTTEQTAPSEIVPQNEAASNIGADNIDIKAEVRAAAKMVVRGIGGTSKALAAFDLDRQKLGAKVLSVVRSKRGMGEKAVPRDVYDNIMGEVDAYINETLTREVLSGAKASVKRSFMFRKGHDTAPVAIRVTATSIHETTFKEQRFALNCKMNAANKRVEEAYKNGTQERIDKAQDGVNAVLEMIRTLDAAIASAQMAMSEGA